MTFRKFAECWLLPVLFFALALAVRLPRLQEIPRFRGGELEVTLSLIQGEEFPLVNQHPHIGALANYLYALGYWLLGVHYWVPRVIAAIAGALTISLTYLLARRLAGTRVAMLSAFMMTVSVYHVFFISHIPYSNNLTPLFVLLTALTFFRAMEQENPLWLVLSGLLYGMALQTHPSVITLFPAVIVLFVLQGKERLRRWIKRPGFYLIIPAACLGCVNLIYYNIVTRLGSVAFQLRYNKYALEKDPGVHSYLANITEEWMLLLRLLAGKAEAMRTQLYWHSPLFVLCAVSMAAGVILLIKSRKLHLPVLFLTPMLILPMINRSYDFCAFGRYLGFVLPLACILSAYAAIRFLDFMIGRLPRLRLMIIPLWLILPFSYCAWHRLELERTYEVLQNTDTTKVFLEARKLLESYDRNHTTILVDLYAYDSKSLTTFLESDGWNVEEMADTTTFSWRKGNVALVRFRHLDSQVVRLQARGGVVAIVSPLVLKSFLTQAGYGALDACLAQGKGVRRNIYKVILNETYFVFRAVPSDMMPDNIMDGASWPEPLQSLVNLAPFIPDDLYHGIPRRKRNQPLRNPEGLPALQLKSLGDSLSSLCTVVPQYPAVPWKICKQEQEHDDDSPGEPPG